MLYEHIKEQVVSSFDYANANILQFNKISYWWTRRQKTDKSMVRYSLKPCSIWFLQMQLQYLFIDFIKNVIAMQIHNEESMEELG